MASPIPHLDLTNTFGVLFLSVVISAALWGLNVVQTWYYFVRYPNDVRFIKPLVIFVMLCNTMHQILITHALYWYLVTNYANPQALALLVWSNILEIVFVALIVAAVTGFLIYRIYLLSGRKWILVVPLGIPAIAEFVLNLIYAIRGLRMKTFVEVTRMRHLGVCVTIMYSVLDVVMALMLCYLLHKSRTGIKQTDTKINRIMLFTINTGMLTSIFATASWITTIVYPDNFIYIAVYFPMVRLYANTLLASLNSRTTSADHTGASFSMRDIPTSFANSGRHDKSRDITVMIDTVKEISEDVKPGSFGS